MHRGLLAAVALGALCSGGCATPMRIEPIEPKMLKALEEQARSGRLSQEAIAMIWDGHVELVLRISVVNSSTQKPIPGAEIRLQRDRRVARHLGRVYGTTPVRLTDTRGAATIRASFPAAGDASGASVFVVDSSVVITAPGYASANTRLAPIYRIDFPRKTREHRVPMSIALAPR